MEIDNYSKSILNRTILEVDLTINDQNSSLNESNWISIAKTQESDIHSSRILRALESNSFFEDELPIQVILNRSRSSSEKFMIEEGLRYHTDYSKFEDDSFSNKMFSIINEDRPMDEVSLICIFECIPEPQPKPPKKSGSSKGSQKIKKPTKKQSAKPRQLNFLKKSK